MASNLVKLISSDNKTFEVDVAVAMESERVKEIIEAKGINEPILLPQQVQGDILAKVVDYCTYHVESWKTSDDKPVAPEDEIKAWDADFVRVDRETLIAIAAIQSLYLFVIRYLLLIDSYCYSTYNNVELSDQASDYLKIENLVDLTCRALVDMIGGKSTAEEIRETFNIENDFTPEDEAEIRRRHDE